MSVIETRGLTKRYGKLTAVERLDLSIEAGTVFGLLGPNGSGKTTTILMLMGLTDITSGEVRVMGFDPAREPLKVKRVVGYMPDAVGFYDQLTARANLRFTGRLAGLPADGLDARIDAALGRVGIADAANRPVAEFSRGMRQRLGLADVLLKAPNVAILDEPTNGLDPQGTHEFLDLIRELKHEGMTILLSSHLLDRVQAVCDRVGLFRHGRMELEGSFEELARKVMGGRYRVSVEARGVDVAKAMSGVPGVGRIERTADARFALACDADVRPAIVTALTGAGGDVLGLSIAEPSLDDVYTRYFTEAEHAAA
jgi:ABC-2 type transport system ATP-binding protein